MASRLTKALASWQTYRRGRVESVLPVVACAAEAIPPAAAARIEAFADPLRRAGFDDALACGPREPGAAIVNHCLVLAHPAEGIRAWVMDLESVHAVNTVLELTTRYGDGTLVGTVNPTLPSIFDRPPWLRVEVLPGATAEDLLAAHRARVAAVADTPVAPWDEDPLATAARENAAVLAYQAERGVLTGKDGDYAYTGRGAARTVSRVARGQSSGAA